MEASVKKSKGFLYKKLICGGEKYMRENKRRNKNGRLSIVEKKRGDR